MHRAWVVDAVDVIERDFQRSADTHLIRLDLPADSVPAWVKAVEQEMVVAPMDWNQLAEEGSGWMAYWDQHVRGSGRKAHPAP